jgi:hypothetical protein
MGVLKWTGETFNIVGRVLTAEDVERWLENGGRGYLEAGEKDLKASWFRGKPRVRDKVLAATGDATGSNGALASALRDCLNRIPGVISNRVDQITKKGDSALFKRNAVGVAVVVPRALVQDRYVRFVCSELGAAASMTEYVGLSEVFLRKRALEAESQFFHSLVKKPPFVLPSKRGLIHSVDSDFDWRTWDTHGHYYIAYGTADKPDLTKRGKRKEFISKIEPALNHIQVSLGKLSEEQLRSVVSSLEG